MSANGKTGIALLLVGAICTVTALRLGVSGQNVIALYVLSAIFLLVGGTILRTDHETRKSEKKDSGTGKESKLEGDLVRKEKPGIGGRPEPFPRSGEGKGEKARDKKTLDEKYAAEHASWVCPRCETINSNVQSFCPCCGYRR